MFQRLVPRYVFASIFDIPLPLLQAYQIKGVILDLDGTIASRKAPHPSPALIEWIDRLKQSGLAVMIVSNNNEGRVKEFCRGLAVPYIARAAKPFRSSFRRAAAILGKKPSEIAVVGDQIYTDTLGGNRFGALTIYVESINKNDKHIKLRYQFERAFVRRGRKRMAQKG